MCFSSVSDCQNKVHTELQLRGCAAVCVLYDKILNVCDLDGVFFFSP